MPNTFKEYMDTNILTNLKDVFREFISYSGLNKFKWDINCYCDKPGYYLIISRDIEYIDLLNSKNLNDLATNLLKPIMDDIENSELVQSCLYNLKTENELLKSQVEELEKYKMYYEMDIQSNGSYSDW